MSNLTHRSTGPAEFKQALMVEVGSTVWQHAAQAPWDPALLRQVEAVLARHVGPIAAVLVRRSAPGCLDLTTLCERLAEQVTNPGSASQGSAPGDAGLGMIPDSLVTASASVLTRSLGPVAAVVARRAARTAPDRAAFFGTLEAVVADPAQRHAMRAQLDELR
ncbi:MAG: hypothetical protein JNN03_13905 [Rubrivivax sp.]|nr:hypothetical protein [Rubrivivax sp.]